MWPANPALGSQLTYGVSGNGVLDAGGPGAALPALAFARAADHVPRLHRIKSSTVELGKAPQRPPVAAPEQRPCPPVASDVVHTAAAEAALLDHSVDPTLGALSVAFSLGQCPPQGQGKAGSGHSTAGSVRAVAFAAGCSLRVVPMVPKTKNLLDTGDRQKSAKRRVAAPALRAAAECRFSFDICQVVVSPDLRLIAVRGHNQVAFVAYAWANGVQLKNADSIQHPPAPLACVAFHKKSLVLVDAEGTLVLYKYSKYKFREQRWLEVPADEPSDHSSWKGICWPEPDSCVLLSRKAVTMVRLDGRDTEKLVSFHIWSHLQDYGVVGQNLFLLTSKEIIWTRAGPEGLQRLVSWKHFLDTFDNTRKLSVCYRPSSDSYTCMVYSEDPIIIVYSFGLINGRPSSLRDPYYIESSKGPLRHLSADEEEGILHLFESTEARTTVSSFCNEQYKSFRPDSEIEAATSVDSVVERKFTSEEEKQLLSQLSEIPPETDQSDAVQNYAFALGGDENPLFASVKTPQKLSLQTFFSLGSMAGVPASISDVEEFESMVDQLAGYYDSQGAGLQSQNAYKCLGGGGVLDVLQKHKSQHCHRAAVLLESGLVKAKGNDLFDNIRSILASETETCSSEVAELLDSWELETPDEKSATQPSPKKKSKNLLHRAITNSQVVSQSGPSSPEKKERKPAETATAPEATPPSQSVVPSLLPASQPLASQAASQKSQPSKRLGSQGSQRKKKKKGGF